VRGWYGRSRRCCCCHKVNWILVWSLASSASASRRRCLCHGRLREWNRKRRQNNVNWAAGRREGQETYFTRQSKCASHLWRSRRIYIYIYIHTHTCIELIYLRAGGISRGRSLTRARDTRAERRALIRDSNSGAICNGMKYASLFRKRSAEIIRGRDSTDPDEIKGIRETQAAEIKRAALPSPSRTKYAVSRNIRQKISMFPFRRISGRNFPSQLFAILISARKAGATKFTE